MRILMSMIWKSDGRSIILRKIVKLLMYSLQLGEPGRRCRTSFRWQRSSMPCDFLGPFAMSRAISTAVKAGRQSGLAFSESFPCTFHIWSTRNLKIIWTEQCSDKPGIWVRPLQVVRSWSIIGGEVMDGTRNYDFVSTTRRMSIAVLAYLKRSCFWNQMLPFLMRESRLRKEALTCSTPLGAFTIFLSPSVFRCSADTSLDSFLGTYILSPTCWTNHYTKRTDPSTAVVESMICMRDP